MIMLGIRTKILILIMAATILPLVALNFFWTYSQRQSLLTDTTSRQGLITKADAQAVNDFLTTKVRTLIIHSQSPSVEEFNKSKAPLELSTLLYQDKDITRAALVDQTGQEVVAMTSNLKNSTLQNVKTSSAFQVVNFYAGNEYISPVTTTNGEPTITIAVPIVSFTSPQDLSDLSTAEPGIVRNPQDIKGALIVQVSLENLWSSVLSNASSTSTGGYAYVVDDKGTIIAHPDSSLTNAHKDISSTPIITAFKHNLGTEVVSGNLQNTSEKGVKVLASYQRVTVTNWGVVYEEPLSSIYTNINRVFSLGLGLALLAILVMGALSFWLSRFISKPILQLADVAKRIGKGDFAAHISMKKRSDEIGALADSVNSMGSNLQEFVQRIDAQRNQLRVVLDSATDAILALDVDGRILFANRAVSELAEEPTAQLIGRRMHDVFPWIRELQAVPIDYTAKGTQTYSDLEYKSPGGVTHFINLVSVQVAENNTLAQAIITIHDETKSRELDAMKLDFVSMAAHELRTPLSAIRGYLELMSYQPPEAMNDAVRKYATSARTSAVTLASLISNLLDVSRIERGTLVLTMDKVDLADVVNTSVQGAHFNANAKKVTLNYGGPLRERWVIADPIAIREVVDNLIDNAIKYTPSGGHIHVHLDAQDNSYVLRVSDNGMGIPANALPYLFTKFYRVHGGLESGSQGTGLGLFISKSIVERHEGAITVQSKEGEGTTFTVTIPQFDQAHFAALKQNSKQQVTDVRRRRGWATKNITR